MINIEKEIIEYKKEGVAAWISSETLKITLYFYGKGTAFL